MWKLLAFLITVLVGVNSKLRFDNYTLYKALPKNLNEIKKLQELYNDKRFDFWSDPAPYADYVSILSNLENKIYLEEYLSAHKINFIVTLPNIQEAIDKETVATYSRSNGRFMNWTTYYDLDSINSWIDSLVETHEEASVIYGGVSYEERQIKGIKISHGAGRKIIFIEGGIHAREWISPAVVNYITNELLTSDDEETRAAAREFDWHIFPVTNPDGYLWTHTENRLWRKNRRPVDSEFGVDLNRNWNINWLGIGASSNPAMDNYAGTGPFSEPETRSLSEYIRSIGDEIEMYLSFHSFGQLLLLPFGNTTDQLANYNDAIKIGRRAMGALSVRFNTLYNAGNVAEAIYLASGVSIDWVKESINVPLVYVYELRDRGNFGSLLPADQILPTGQETMDSILELIHQAKRLGYMSSSASTLQATIALLSSLTIVFIILSI
ncbi:hypothetical protein ACJJTC_009428 [Scirpophaga incertulas]